MKRSIKLMVAVFGFALTGNMAARNYVFLNASTYDIYLNEPGNTGDGHQIKPGMSNPRAYDISSSINSFIIHCSVVRGKIEISPNNKPISDFLYGAVPVSHMRTVSSQTDLDKAAVLSSKIVCSAGVSAIMNDPNATIYLVINVGRVSPKGGISVGAMTCAEAKKLYPKAVTSPCPAK